MKRIWTWTALFLLLIWLWLSLGVHLAILEPIDWSALTFLHITLPRTVDVPFSLLSFLGSAEVTTLILLALLIRAHPAQRLPLLAAFGIMTLIELAGKSLISQPIPPHELVRTILFFSIPSGALKTAYAFPSGHAARTTFIVIVLMGMVAASPLAARTKKWEYASLCLIEALMLVSRVYLVEHWLSDVVGGALLGGAFALIALDWKIKPPNALGRNF